MAVDVGELIPSWSALMVAMTPGTVVVAGTRVPCRGSGLKGQNIEGSGGGRPRWSSGREARVTTKLW